MLEFYQFFDQVVQIQTNYEKKLVSFVIEKIRKQHNVKE